jgi:hypothetical protein
MRLWRVLGRRGFGGLARLACMVCIGGQGLKI